MKLTALTLAFAAIFAFAFNHAAFAAKVDCDKVMEEINGGKHSKEVAKDMGISVSSVSRCKHKAKQESKSTTDKMSPNQGAQAMSSAVSAGASPAAAASTGAATAAQKKN